MPFRIKIDLAHCKSLSARQSTGTRTTKWFASNPSIPENTSIEYARTTSSANSLACSYLRITPPMFVSRVHFKSLQNREILTFRETSKLIFAASIPTFDVASAFDDSKNDKIPNIQRTTNNFILTSFPTPRCHRVSQVSNSLASCRQKRNCLDHVEFFDRLAGVDVESSHSLSQPSPAEGEHGW